MTPHVRVLERVPEDIFLAARNEVAAIDWSNLPVADHRGHLWTFKTSSTLHLRAPATSDDTIPMAEAISDIIQSRDTKGRWLYPALNRLVDWMYQTVEGTVLGRIMVVRLAAEGDVPTHVDLGEYFNFYYRFHVPILTNPDVVFSGPPGAKPIHMPEATLCQLLNGNEHGVINKSRLDRVHLIADIASDVDRFKYPMDPLRTSPEFATLVINVRIPPGKLPKDYFIDRSAWTNMQIANALLIGLQKKDLVIRKGYNWDEGERRLSLTLLFKDPKSCRQCLDLILKDIYVRPEIGQQMGYEIEYDIV